MRVLKWPENQSEIKEAWKDKQDNEFELAKALEDYFNEPPLIQMLCILANEAISDLMTGADPGELKAFLTGKGPSPFRFWQPKRIDKRIMDAKPDALKQKLRKLPWASPDARAAVFNAIVVNDLARCFDAADCGDIFCIYGDFIENCKKQKSVDYFKSSKKMPKQLSPKTKAMPSMPEEEELKEEVKVDKKQPYKLLVHEDYRKARRKPRIQRDWNGAGGAIDFFKKPPKGAPKDMQHTLSCQNFRIRGARKDVRPPKDIEKRKGQLVGRARLAEGVMAGLVRFTLADESSIKQIDKMFGLIRGADISGTTADTVFGLETLMHSFQAGIHKGKKEKWEDKDVAQWMEDALRIKEILYLLPLATMGAQAHHTILECAFTLSLNDYIDYSIGMYTTLIPKHWDIIFWDKDHSRHKTVAPITKQFRDAVMNLVRILNNYEQIPHNPLILQCYKNPQSKTPIQVYEFNKDSNPEKSLFWMISNFRRNMKRWASQLYSADLKQRYPSQDLVESAIRYWAWILRIPLDDNWRLQEEKLDRQRFDPVKASEPKDRTSLDQEFAKSILKGRKRR